MNSEHLGMPVNCGNITRYTIIRKNSTTSITRQVQLHISQGNTNNSVNISNVFPKRQKKGLQIAFKLCVIVQMIAFDNDSKSEHLSTCILLLCLNIPWAIIKQ